MMDEGKTATLGDAALGFRGYPRTLRAFVLPLMALATIAAIASAGMAESRAERPATCGLAITVQDPDLRASFVRFGQQQSAAARKICAIYRDWH